MKKAVVTGATSMIGLALIEFLISEGIEVLAITRRTTLKLQELNKTGKCKIIICNLNDISSLNIRDIVTNYDVFFHLAWAGTFGDIRTNSYIQSENIKYTLSCVDLAHKLGCNTFVGVGSQAEYGRVNGVINYNTPTNPETPYGIAKFAANKISKQHAQTFGMKHVWVRIFSVYGPYDNPKTMVMSSIFNFLKGNTMEYTAATQMWNYLYVDDAAKGIYLASIKGISGEVYCIADRFNYPLKDYISLIRNKINPNAEIKFGKIPYVGGKPIELCVNTQREEKELGFVPTYSFDSGIEKTINWFKANCS